MDSGIDGIRQERRPEDAAVRAAADLRRWCDNVQRYCRRDSDPTRMAERVIVAARMLCAAERSGLAQDDLQWALDCAGMGGIDSDAAAARVVDAAVLYRAALDQAAGVAIRDRIATAPAPGV